MVRVPPTRLALAVSSLLHLVFIARTSLRLGAAASLVAVFTIGLLFTRPARCR